MPGLPVIVTATLSPGATTVVERDTCGCAMTLETRRELIRRTRTSTRFTTVDSFGISLVTFCGRRLPDPLQLRYRNRCVKGDTAPGTSDGGSDEPVVPGRTCLSQASWN